MDLAVKNSIKPKTVETRNFPSLQNHAVVVGGSIAGMLAARVLADHFTSVTIVETVDILPDLKGTGIPKITLWFSSFHELTCPVELPHPSIGQSLQKRFLVLD